MADGWLFRLRSTLGAPQAAPAWPASDPRADLTGTNEPALALARPEPLHGAAGDDEDRPRR